MWDMTITFLAAFTLLGTLAIFGGTLSLGSRR